MKKVKEKLQWCLLDKVDIGGNQFKVLESNTIIYYSFNIYYNGENFTLKMNRYNRGVYISFHSNVEAAKRKARSLIKHKDITDRYNGYREWKIQV